LVDVILKSANAEKSGMIDRVQLKQALVENQDKVMAITAESLPQTNTVVAHVMDSLNSTNSGTIRKIDFKKALLTFNYENQAELDVDSIVSDVFKDQVSLDRSEIRIEMSSNPLV
jgi:hypothetical protein